jgi:hypothetical protein
MRIGSKKSLAKRIARSVYRGISCAAWCDGILSQAPERLCKQENCSDTSLS